MTAGFRHEIAPITNDWQTPPSFIEALGPFDLDPCASEVQHFPCASINAFQSSFGSGLMMDWRPYRSVWLNPPYDRFEISKWMTKLADHGNGIALVYARTDTAWFQDQVLARAYALYFIRLRVKFIKAETGRISGKSSAPCVLVAYGVEMAGRLALLSGERIPGTYVELR